MVCLILLVCKVYPVAPSVRRKTLSVLSSFDNGAVAAARRDEATTGVANRRPCASTYSMPYGDAHRDVPSAILIDTRAREGSSLLLGLLNLDPGIVSFYEPCAALPLYSKDLREKRGIFGRRVGCGDLVNRIATCQADSDLIARILRMKSQEKYCLRESFEQLISSSFDDSSDVARAYCRLRIVAIKSIRLERPGTSFLESAKESGRGRKVIQLVRDPRAVMNSWIKLNWCNYGNKSEPIDVFSCAEAFCSDVLRTLDTYDRDARATSDNYIVVRHEDFVADPVAFTTNLYAWIGLRPPSAQALQWIAANTALDSGGPRRTYSLSRNATASATHWRVELSSAQRDSIERSPSCARLIRREFADSEIIF
eukprot:g357.t1